MMMNNMPARTPEQGLVVVLECTARIVVVELDTTEHTTAQASGSSLLLPFPGSTPQMDEATLRVSQKAQKGVKEVRVLYSAVDVDSQQRTAVDHVHPLYSSTAATRKRGAERQLIHLPTYLPSNSCI